MFRRRGSGEGDKKKGFKRRGSVEGGSGEESSGERGLGEGVPEKDSLGVSGGLKIYITGFRSIFVRIQRFLGDG